MQTLHASAAPGAAFAPSLAAPPPSILDAAGVPRWGAFAGEVERAAEIAGARGAGGSGLTGQLRWKRWLYVFVGGPRVLAGFAIADVGYLGSCFGYAYDRERGEPSAGGDRGGVSPPLATERLEESWLSPMGLGVRVAGGLAGAAASGVAGERRITARAEGTGLRLEARLGQLAADVRVERTDVPLTAVSELEGPSCPGATVKSAGVPASGAITVAGRRLDLEGSFAVLDYTVARFGYTTDWRWASMTGRDRAGRPVGLNACRGVHDGTPSTGHTENALWLEGRPAALPRITLEVGKGGKDPWRLRGGGIDEGAYVDLEFRPLGERSEDVNLGVIRSRFRQAFGTYHGKVRDREGRATEVDGAVGVVEDHHARW